jgi:O-antigen/teichoic acid export membrane protein
MMTFTLLAVVKKSLVFAVVISAAISLLVDIYLIVVSCSIANVGRIRICFDKIYSLIRQCVSLFLAAFMTYYVTNAPKYAIDKFLSEDIQAYFGYISMPVFIVELLNCFLYQPQMVNLADEWNCGLLNDFDKRTRRQYIVIFGLTIICALGAYILGIPILSIVYGVGLDQFKTELVVLMVSGGALAFVGYTSVLLTIMRKQNILLCNMTVITILAYLGFGRVVVYKGMIGAIYYYLFLMAVLAIMNYCCTILVKYKCKSTTK